MISCYVDGGYDNIRKQNPYFSYKIYKNGKVVQWIKKEVCNARTNNQAEYMGLIYLLVYLASYKPNEPIMIYSDSKLVVEQVNNNWKVKNEDLQYYWHVTQNLKNLIKFDLVWVPREIMVKELGH